ncbi:MAG TPA: septal ring lytic transglycosylase RlpA family protein [Terriglobia bacterium]|nr:septal ring lytic transglycosylase RlpA family protein [Terriglobia bacterium]
MRWPAGMAVALILYSLPLQGFSRSSGAPARRPFGIRAKADNRTIQFGLASWYGARFQWHITASGVPFDDRKLTAAHRTLPLGTRVKVTNLNNGRSVILRVTDRGPWIRGRLIDVSRAAADRLGFAYRGLTRVRVVVIRDSD